MSKKLIKLIMLDGSEYYLDKTLDYQQRKDIVDNLLLTYNDNLISSWENRKTKVILDILTNYLYPFEVLNDENNVLSREKEKRMMQGCKQYVLFDNLPYDTKCKLGVIDNNKYNHLDN